MIGILGGTSFRHLAALRKGSSGRVVTPYGSVETIRLQGSVVILRHGSNGTVPPHRINHHAHVWALHSLGVRGIVSFGSTGGLGQWCPPGTQVLADDFYAPFRPVSYFDHDLRVTIPDLRGPWRTEVLGALDDAGCNVLDGGVYVETLGPRFETRAEIRTLATSADVIGMTCASEATLAMELELPAAILATVDNYAHGIGGKKITEHALRRTVKKNSEKVVRAFEAVRKLGS
ncbi:MAG: S-methyl-5'-thioinosine phosphorylase [Calditrichaeota bacterium]|nr:S-methyl-5'-thioinosine phosphorylase [Calditrichota bacterium]